MQIKYFLLGLFAALALSSCSDERVLSGDDWKVTYQNRHTIPYGTYITYNLLDSVFSEGKIRTSRNDITSEINDVVGTYDRYTEYWNADSSKYLPIEISLTDEYLTESVYDYDAYDKYSYLFINLAFSPDEEDTDRLLDFVGLGHDVFIAAEHYDTTFLRRMGLEYKRDTTQKWILQLRADTTYVLRDYTAKEYTFSNTSYAHYINTLMMDSCTLPVEILATNKSNEASFVRVKYGYGYFYLHFVPVSFTNLYMLDYNRYDFGFRSLSYLDKDSHIIWDEFSKRGGYKSSSDDSSMFQEIYKSPALTTAFILILIGIFLFMVFRAKRKQRVIPILKAPVNSSIEFLNTISNMYYKKKDYESAVSKRHMYFLDYIRKNYYLQTEETDNDFREMLSAKSGVSMITIDNIFNYYQNYERIGNISREDFLKYNQQLESFYKTAKNK